MRLALSDTEGFLRRTWSKMKEHVPFKRVRASKVADNRSIITWLSGEYDVLADHFGEEPARNAFPNGANKIEGMFCWGSWTTRILQYK